MRAGGDSGAPLWQGYGVDPIPSQEAPAWTSLPRVALPLELSFAGGRLTSDGGLLWLDQAEAALGICATFAATIPEWRRGPVCHPLHSLVRQRGFQIGCGYEDQDCAP